MNKDLKDHGPKPFVVDVEKLTIDNKNYRTVIWTGKYMQMTVMSIPPGEDIGLELHKDHDQFIRIEEGEGIVQMGDSEDNLDFQEKVEDDFAILIPAGKWHNLVNNSTEPLKLYSIYSPVEHPKNTVHKTKQGEVIKHFSGGKLNNHTNINMKFNKEKIKKFQPGGKTPQQIMAEARRNQAIGIQEAQARAISQDAQQTAARDIALDSQQTAAREIYLDTLRTAAREQGGLGRTRVVNEPAANTNADVKPQTFNQAFAAARKAGLKEFEWFNPRTKKLGKFTTALKSETAPAGATQQSESESESAPAPASVGNTANTWFFGSNRTTPIFNTNSGLDISRLVIPEGQQYGQSQEDIEDTEGTENTENTEYTEGTTSRGQLLRIGNPTNTGFNINPNFRNSSGLDLSRLVLPPVWPTRTSAATTVTNRFNTPIIQLGKNPVSRNPYYQQGGTITNSTNSSDELYADFAIRLLSSLGLSEDEILVNGELNPQYSEMVINSINEIDTPEFWNAYVQNPDQIVNEYINSKSPQENMDTETSSAVDEDSDIEFARKGAALKQLRKNKKTLTCKCGCKMTSKRKGGKLVTKCSCGCKS